MTEDEAWDELENRLNRTNLTKSQANDVTDLIQKAIDMERTACAKTYRKIMDDAVNRAILREREACAKFCIARAHDWGSSALMDCASEMMKGRTE
jgi:predicted site-specific integrase-resolvase